MAITQPTPIAPQKELRQESESRLLNLPAELRNRIYEYVACSEAPRLGPSGVLQPDLMFARTSHQVRGELLAVFRTFLRQQALGFYVTVQDLEFGGLGRLVERLQPLAHGGKQLVEVTLVLSSGTAGAGAVGLEGLEEWLRLCSTSERMGHVRVRYGPALFDWEHYSIDSAQELEARVAEVRRRVCGVREGEGDAMDDGSRIKRALMVTRLQRRLEALEEERASARRDTERLEAATRVAVEETRVVRLRLKATLEVARRQLRGMKKTVRLRSKRKAQEEGEGRALKRRRFAGLAGP
ncbi:hypothetical protein LTR65_001986 [Meristemomyces frigidus]